MKDYNILYAEYVVEGTTFHLSHIAEMKDLSCLETGKHTTMGRKQFRELCKTIGAKTYKPLAFGEYVNVNTGKIEKIYGV